MNKLPKIIIGALWIFFSSFSPEDVFAVVVASQDQTFSDPFYVWQAIQELGSDLSGTAQSFTFRVNTSRTNLNQFNYTASNSRIYDKDNNNSNISSCVTNASDPLNGLVFTTSGVPSGFEDVTIDFSCRNYTFIPGHRYLIFITNANMGNSGSGQILFAAASYSGTSNDYFTGGGLRYAYDNGYCNASSYVWNSQVANNGCNIWGTAKADLYFILTNADPDPTLTPTPTPTSSPDPTPTPSPTPTPTPTPTPSPSDTPSPTPTPSPSPSPTPTPSPSSASEDASAPTLAPIPTPVPVIPSLPHPSATPVFVLKARPWPVWLSQRVQESSPSAVLGTSLQNTNLPNDSKNQIPKILLIVLGWFIVMSSMRKAHKSLNPKSHH